MNFLPVLFSLSRPLPSLVLFSLNPSNLNRTENAQRDIIEQTSVTRGVEGGRERGASNEALTCSFFEEVKPSIKIKKSTSSCSRKPPAPTLPIGLLG